MEKKSIGERIEFLNTKEAGLVIEINQQTTLMKKLFLFFWMVVIVIAGYMIMVEYSKLPKQTADSGINMTMITYLAFIALWLFYLYKIGKVMLWRLMGKEVISIKDGLLSINNKYGKIGKPQKFTIQDITKFRGIERSNDLIKGYFNYEFLTTTGDRFEFSHNKKEYIFGKQISDKDTIALGRIINDALNRGRRALKK